MRQKRPVTKALRNVEAVQARLHLFGTEAKECAEHRDFNFQPGRLRGRNRGKARIMPGSGESAISHREIERFLRLQAANAAAQGAAVVQGNKRCPGLGQLLRGKALSSGTEFEWRRLGGGGDARAR